MFFASRKKKRKRKTQVCQIKNPFFVEKDNIAKHDTFTQNVPV